MNTCWSETIDFLRHTMRTAMEFLFRIIEKSLTYHQKAHVKSFQICGQKLLSEQNSVFYSYLYTDI